MPNDLDLDDRIRSLVASAVADAPPAPVVEPSVVVTRRRPNWLRRGAIALAALLAAGGGVAMLQPANNGDVDTTRDTTVTTPFVPRQEQVIVTAGPDGIREFVDGVERVVSREPFEEAFALDNGDVVALRSSTPTRDPLATTPVRIAGDGTVTPLFDHPVGQARVIIHDFAVVDGRRLLLYSVDTGSSSDPAGGLQTLYAMDLDTNAVTEIAKVGDSFSSAYVLNLGSNGLIVGSRSVTSACGFCYEPSASISLLVLAVPGSPAAARPLPKPRDYGLEDKYEYPECQCPMNFFTDATGTSLYWVSVSPEGTGHAVYSARIAEPGRAPRLVKELPDLGGANIAGTFADVSAHGFVVNTGFQKEGALVQQHFLLEGDSVVELGGYVTVGWQG